MSKRETSVKVSGAPGYADFTGILVGARKDFSEGQEVTWYEMPDSMPNKCVVCTEEAGKTHFAVVPADCVEITTVRDSSGKRH